MGTMIMHKYQGLGNDYLVLDPNQNQVLLQERKIQMLCQRNFGAGADGILYGPLFLNGNIHVSIFNPDGSEAGQSGNGLQIFAKYLSDQGYVTEQKFMLAAKAKDTEVEFLDEQKSRMRVHMGKADFMAASAPAGGFIHEMINEPLIFGGILYHAACLSVGNPHCVIMAEDVSRSAVSALGPYVENAPYFPDRMNLQLCKPIDRNRLKLETYERGAGYTLSSGTGACAAAAAAFRLGLCGRRVTVEMPGGELLVEIAENGDISMTGTVEKVGTFLLEEDFFS